jgi:3-methyladenine DNA glycosylase AlkD
MVEPTHNEITTSSKARLRKHGGIKRAPRLADLRQALAQAADPQRVGSLAWFKKGKGEYAEGDKFLGVSMPTQRVIAKRYQHLAVEQIEKLLGSRIHEHRLTGLLILVAQYEAGNRAARQRVFEFYLDHLHAVDNWDLVDASAPYILGEHLVSRSRRVLYDLAKSSGLWERRIAMVATAAFISRGDLKDTFAVATQLLGDEHDLIHKAVGWMLREAGDRSRDQLIGFLERNYSRVPRTTLRYAIEHFPKAERKRALKGLFSRGDVKEQGRFSKSRLYPLSRAERT